MLQQLIEPSTRPARSEHLTETNQVCLLIDSLFPKKKMRGGGKRERVAYLLRSDLLWYGTGTGVSQRHDLCRYHIGY